MQPHSEGVARQLSTSVEPAIAPEALSLIDNGTHPQLDLTAQILENRRVSTELASIRRERDADRVELAAVREQRDAFREKLAKERKERDVERSENGQLRSANELLEVEVTDLRREVARLASVVSTTTNTSLSDASFLSNPVGVRCSLRLLLISIITSISCRFAYPETLEPYL